MAQPFVWIGATITLIALITGSRFLACVAGLIWATLWALILSETYLPDPSGVRDFAIAEGCIGPATLTLPTSLGLALFCLYKTIKPRRHALSLSSFHKYFGG